MKQAEIWIGTSWKMNKTLAQAMQFATQLANADKDCDPKIQRFVIPSFTAVREVKKQLASTSVLVGAQNMHWDDAGAWTGEVSPTMLADCDLDIVELGHSERREFFAETDETVGLKVAAAVKHGLTPLICIGETREQRDADRAETVLAEQVKTSLSQLSEEQKTAQILFAYEPVWAIGAGGTPASASCADKQQRHIVAVAHQVLGRRVPCLYGGSVNPDNCEDLIRCDHIDGLFIGRSAWDVSGYLDILTRCSAALK